MRCTSSSVKVLFKDMKNGEIKLRVEVEDDLWHLYNIVEPGDLVFSLTQRREEKQSDRIRAERGEKKTMRLGIRVEKVEFHEFTDRLRILGVIEQGPQDIGEHHTFNIKVGSELSIIKEKWESRHLKRLDEAIKSVERPLITFLTLEDNEAEIIILREYGIKKIASISTSGTGKQYKSSKKEEFFVEILKALREFYKGGELLIIGPGFTKEEFFSWAKEKEPQLMERAHVYAASHGGTVGVSEVMKKIGAEILENSRIAVETRAVERLFVEISKNGAYAYGKEDVKNYLKQGAVDTLLISSKLMRTHEGEEYMRLAEESGAEVIVISEFGDPGKKLEAIGGIGAILRFVPR
jgi:protein pelota